MIHDVIFSCLLLLCNSINQHNIEQYYLTEIKQLFKSFQKEYENDKLFMKNYNIDLQEKKLIIIYTNGIRLIFCVPIE